MESILGDGLTWMSMLLVYLSLKVEERDLAEDLEERCSGKQILLFGGIYLTSIASSFC